MAYCVSLVVATDAMVAANVLTGFMDTMPPTSVRVAALPTGSLKLEFPARGGLPPRRHRVHLALSSRCQATAQEDGCDDGEAEGDGHRVEGFAEQRDGEDHSEDGLHQLHLADPDRATKGETPVPEEEAGPHGPDGDIQEPEPGRG